MRVYQIEYLPEVLHDVLLLGVRDQQAIKAKIEWLSVYPTKSHINDSRENDLSTNSNQGWETIESSILLIGNVA